MTNACRHCGSSFPDGANYCLTCGKRLFELPATAEPATPDTSTNAAHAAHERNASQLEELSALSWRPDPASIMQVIDRDDYQAIVQRVYDLRKQVAGLARLTDFDPQRFFALFDRVRCSPWYVPDFLFMPIPRPGLNMQHPPIFGPGPGRKWPRAVDIAEEMDGCVYLYTRPAILPRWYPRVLQPTRHLVAYEYAQLLGLSGLRMERSALGFLQFAILHQEASLWQAETSGWRYAADWQWVASPEHLEELIAFVDTSSPSPWSHAKLTEQQRLVLRQVDPQLRVRMQGKQAQVGGLAYSSWDGFAWLECELRAPNSFRISRLKEFGIGKLSRNLPWY